METIYSIESYDYHLPEAQIAQKPAPRREGSRLLQVDCQSGLILDGAFSDLPRLFAPGDVMVLNDTRVFPARLLGRKETGGKVELLLLHYPEPVPGVSGEADVESLLKSSKRPKPASRIVFGPDLEATIKKIRADGSAQVFLRWQGDLIEVLKRYGQLPLPPYINRNSGPDADDNRRYQTVYARKNGAIAAPTAGLHFTDELLAGLRALGVAIKMVTLHVGYGTFAPVRTNDIREHSIHSEWVAVPAETAEAISQAKAAGNRVWAIGTTSARALEFAADGLGGVRTGAGDCRLYIYPGYEYKVVDNLITNFHLPKSSLLFMVSAFAGRELVMGAYREALRLGYRFYSYGDAMALIQKTK